MAYSRTTEAQSHRGPLLKKGLCLCVSVVCGLWLSSATAQQLLDRVVARVAGTAITQTEVEAALALGIVEAEGADRLAAGTRQMIDRRLVLAEVARFPPSEPPEPAIAGLVAKMKARAGADYPAVLRQTGLDEQRVRDMARDTLRIQAYLDQRFGTTAQASLQEARDYYEANRQAFARNGAVPPFDQVESEARAAASAQRRRATVAQWLGDLRTRADVVDLTSRP